MMFALWNFGRVLSPDFKQNQSPWPCPVAGLFELKQYSNKYYFK